MPEVQGKPVYGGTLRMVMPLSMKTLDPMHNVAYREQILVFAIYENLVELDEDFNVVPSLAKSWDFSSDGKTVIFHLKKGIKFHDGTDFTAEDVKWQWEHMIDPEFGATRSQAKIFGPVIDSIEATDTYTVTFNLNKPFRPLLGHMGLSYLSLISPDAYEKYGRDDYGRNPTGTGPFKLDEWMPGVTISLAKNEDYWQEGKPYLDAIVFQPVTDKSVQLAMLRTGETDIIDEVPPSQLALVKDDPNVKIVPHDTGRWNALAMDTRIKPFNNKAFREAVGYATNRQEIVDVWLNGNGRPDYTAGLAWYEDRSYQPFLHDLEKAKAKVAEAGFPNGAEVQMDVQGTDVWLELAEIIQAQLAEANINATINQVLAQDYWANWKLPPSDPKKNRFAITIWYPRPDPDWVLFHVLHCGGTTGAMRLGYCNEEASRLVEEASGVYDVAKAGALYIQAQKLVFDDAPYITLFNETLFAGLNSRVQNFTWIPDTLVRLSYLWLEE